MTDAFEIAQGCLIVNGPSREEIFDCLRLFPERRTVKFQLVDSEGPVLETHVVGIEPEDGSGHNWCLRVGFRGYHAMDIYYNDTRRAGAVVDERPLENRVSVDRQGRIWLKGHQVASMPQLR